MIRRIGRPGLLGLAARTAVVAGTATAVSGHMQAKSQAEYEQQQYQAAQQQAQINAAAAQAAATQAPSAPAAPAAPAAGGVDIVAELQKLSALKDAGALTDAEFAAAKARLLA